MIVIDTPNARLEFPPDTPTDVIRRQIAEHAQDDASRKSALDQWAHQYVADERKNGGIGQAISDTVRNVARGTPVGSWLDEANAATQQGLSYLTGGRVGAPYDETAAYQRATDQAVDADHPMLSTAGKLAGAVASVPIAPVANVVRGSTLIPQAANAALNGIGYGALYGAGEGEGASRIPDAMKGAAIGGSLGAVAPAVAKGIGNAAGYVADQIKGVPAELAGLSRTAVNRVSRAAADDALNQPAYARLSGQLGPEGMLADMGQNLQSQAGAIANQPGAGQNALANALEARRAAAPDRISNDLNAALGPRVNLLDAEQRIRQHYGAQAEPLYQQFRQSPVPFTPELEGVLNRLDAEPSILRQAQKYARLDGTDTPRQFFAQIGDDGSVSIARVPNASELDYVKRALDDAARTAKPGTNESRIYGDMARKVRDAVDTALSPNDPSASVYARARAVAGEGIGLRNAMDEGKSAFSKGVSPDQMRADLSNMSQAERLAYALGARQQIADTMGNSATAFGANGDTAARRALGSDYAREKLGLVAGNDAADTLTRRLDAETAFDKTRQAVTQNSKTASRLQAQKEFPNSADASIPVELGQRSAFGTFVADPAYRIANALTGGAVNERRAAIASDAAKLLSENGPNRDAIVRALLQYGDSKAVTKQGKDAIGRLAQVLLEGTRPLAIEYATNR